jgi:hypothetical protein
MADADARSESSAHPLAHLWDDGISPLESFKKLLEIRRTILGKMGTNVIKTGAPMATIEEALVPIYLLHRYQLEALSKTIGGLDYTYAVKGDGQLVTKFLDPKLQKDAFTALLESLVPYNLTLPESLIALIPPRPVNFGRSRETFKSNTGLTFDPLAAAESLTNTTLKLMLNPERLERLVLHHSRDQAQPALEELLNKLVEKNITKVIPADNYEGEIQRMVQLVTLKNLLNLLASGRTPDNVKARVEVALFEIEYFISNQTRVPSLKQNSFETGTYLQMKTMINNFELNPADFKLPDPLPMPDGAPIGAENFDY